MMPTERLTRAAAIAALHSRDTTITDTDRAVYAFIASTLSEAARVAERFSGDAIEAVYFAELELADALCAEVTA